MILIWQAEAPLRRRETWLHQRTINTFQTRNQTKPRPKWKDEPSAKDRAEGWEQLQRLKDRHSFLRNPRFLPPSAQQGGTSLIRPRAKAGKTGHVRRGMEERRYLSPCHHHIIMKACHRVGNIKRQDIDIVGRIWKSCMGWWNTSGFGQTIWLQY